MIKAFVIGHPIAHSRSPLIHNHWLQTLGINGSYEAVDVSPEALPDFIDALRAGAYSGGNVTVPHKQAAFALCDVLEADAQTIGAVNTLVMRDGKLQGSNTDMEGFLGNLDQKAPGWDRRGDTAIVLGAGGAARAVLVGLARRGFKAIHILNRTAANAQNLARELPGPFTGAGLTAFAALAPQAALVVNTSTIGMHGTRFDALDLALLPETALVTDIVYTPLETPLLADARALGLDTVDGLGMLLHQAVPGFEAWFGIRPQVTPALRALAVQSLGEQ